ncbi:hypothetical protein ACQP3C_30395, partial [Escherichia coli]
LLAEGCLASGPGYRPPSSLFSLVCFLLSPLSSLDFSSYLFIYACQPRLPFLLPIFWLFNFLLE